MSKSTCNHWSVVLALLALSVAAGNSALAQTTLAQDAVTEHAVPIEPGKRLVIRHSYGSICLRTGEAREVALRVDRRLVGVTREAIQAYHKAMRVVVQAQDDRVEIRIERPPGAPKHLTRTTVDLDVTLPADVPVEVSNSFGDLDAQGIGGLRATSPFGALTVRGISGDVTLEGKHGKVLVSDVRGTVTVTHAFGDVDVRRVGGGLVARNQYAQIRIQGVGQRAVVENRSGPITLTNLIGGAQVTSQNGQVEISRVQGDLSVVNRNESISVTDAQGAVVLQNANGSVNARQVTGDLKIESNFGPVTVNQVTGKVNVRHSNGPLRVRGVKGPVTLANSHGLVDVREITGDCAVQNEFASVTARQVWGGLEVKNAWGTVQADVSRTPEGITQGPWTLRTNHSNVVLGVLPDTGCTLGVEVNSGAIETQFPLEVRRSGSKDTVQADIHGGGVKVEVRVDLGMAQIQRRHPHPPKAAK